MHKWADKILENLDEIVTLECEDIGKSRADATGDVMFSTLIIRYYAGLANHIRGESFMRDSMGFRENQFGYTRKEPVGVCGLITPWNYPLLMATFKMAPMLASGCTGVHKAAELAPLSSIMMADLWNQVEGVPAGVLNSLPGIGAEAGEALVDHMGVNKIGFTGSTAIGKRIMSRGVQSNMKRVNLELGGKGPLIVFNDGDVDKAVESTVKHGMACSG